MATLTGKTATLGNFQRVRGMLRLLARTWRICGTNGPPTPPPCTCITSTRGTNPIRQEIVTRLGQTAYVPAIANDVAGGKALGAGNRRRPPRRPAAVCRLRRPHRLPAHPRLQRTAQGPAGRTTALRHSQPGAGRQLHRGSAQEIHRRLRLPRRPARRPMRFWPRPPAPDHPARGTARRPRRGPRLSQRPHPGDIQRPDVRRRMLPRRAVRRARRGRRRAAETGRSGLRRRHRRRLGRRRPRTDLAHPCPQRRRRLRPAGISQQRRLRSRGRGPAGGHAAPDGLSPSPAGVEKNRNASPIWPSTSRTRCANWKCGRSRNWPWRFSSVTGTSSTRRATGGDERRRPGAYRHRHPLGLRAARRRPATGRAGAA